MPTFTRLLHAGLTVRDYRASAAWYMRVLGFHFVREFRFAPGEQGIPRILLLHPDSGYLVGLYNHENRSDDAFSPFRTGLDHLAFEVHSEAELAEWMAHFDAEGVAHSPVRDLGHSAFVSFEDPDGIQYEVWYTRTRHVATDTTLDA